jgi:hypothetical protein
MICIQFAQLTGYYNIGALLMMSHQEATLVGIQNWNEKHHEY